MKHIFFLFSVLFTIIFISSCNLNTTSHEYRDVCDNTIVIGVTRQDLIDFKPGLLFDKFDLIPLEESAESLVGVIKKMVVKDSAIFILDDTRKILLKFDAIGKYLGQIGSIGRGQGEYLQLADFQVSRDTILLWDYRQKKMAFYTLDGSFIKEQVTNDYFLSFAKLDNDYWAYTAGINEEGSGKEGFNLRNYKGNLNSNDIFDFLPASNFYPRTFNKTNIFNYGDSAIFSFGLSNVIYRISNSGIHPYIFVDGGKNSIPYNTIKDQPLSMQECSDYVNNNDYIGIISNCLESSRYLYFNVTETKTGELIHTIYDKVDKKSLSFKDIVEDDSNVIISGTPCFIDDVYFYYLLPSFYFDIPNIEEFIKQYCISDTYTINNYNTILIRARIKDSLK